jgi:hypothetical protein
MRQAIPGTDPLIRGRIELSHANRSQVRPVSNPDALAPPRNVEGNVGAIDTVVIVTAVAVQSHDDWLAFSITTGLKMTRLDLDMIQVAETHYLAGTAPADTGAKQQAEKPSH